MSKVEQIQVMLASLSREELLTIAQDALNRAQADDNTHPFEERPLTEEEIAEFDRRFQEVEADPSKGISLDDFIKNSIEPRLSLS